MKRGSRVDEADLGHQQHARVQILAAEALDEGLPALAPRLLENLGADRVGAGAPRRVARCLADDGGDLRQPVAGGPAHQRRRRVDASAGAQLPHAGVGLIVEAPGLLAHAFELGEVAQVGAPEQAMVEERLRRAQHDVAVDVVLEVLVRLVADAHRTHAAITRERRHGAFGEDLLEADPVERLDVAATGAAHDVVEPAQVVFHRPHFREAVQRPDDEERVAQPAEAVVPVATGVGRFGDAGRHGRDDRPGLLELAKLQGDRGADHRVLPLERHRQAPAPAPPVQRRLLLELARGFLDPPGQRLVGPEQEAHRDLQ